MVNEGMYTYDVVIVGGGIAGFSAALYTARQGLRTAVVSIDIGGQLSYATVVENYPGADPVSGLDLVLRVQRQATSFGAEVFIDEVVFIEKVGEVFRVRTKKGEVFEALAVIAACGKAPKRLGIENEDLYVGRGLSYCVICDAPLYRGKDVALVSFGDKGVEALEQLSSIAKKVYYITPTDKDLSIEKARDLINVELYPGFKVTEIGGQNRVETVTLRSASGDKIILRVDGVFVELGFETRIDFLKGLVDVNEKGEVIVDSYGRTKTRGLFAAGDLVITPYKQAVIAAASGVIAALSAVSYVYEVKGLKKHIVYDWEKRSKKPVSRGFRL